MIQLSGSAATTCQNIVSCFLMPLLRNCASTERNQADRLLNHGGGSEKEIAFMESLSPIVTRDEQLAKQKMCGI